MWYIYDSQRQILAVAVRFEALISNPRSVVSFTLGSDGGYHVADVAHIALEVIHPVLPHEEVIVLR